LIISLILADCDNFGTTSHIFTSSIMTRHNQTFCGTVS